MTSVAEMTAPPTGWEYNEAIPDAAALRAWRIVLNLDWEAPIRPAPSREDSMLIIRRFAAAKSFGATGAELPWRRIRDAMRTNFESVLPTQEQKVDVERLREWLLSDSLDWDAVEKARDEGWR